MVQEKLKKNHVQTKKKKEKANFTCLLTYRVQSFGAG